MIECQRCGKCCHYIKDGVVKECKYLVTFPSKKTFCRVWRTRHKVTIDKLGDKVVKCVNRDVSPFDYEGCPYNTDKPRFEKEVEAMTNGNNHPGEVNGDRQQS